MDLIKIANKFRFTFKNYMHQNKKKEIIINLLYPVEREQFIRNIELNKVNMIR